MIAGEHEAFILSLGDDCAVFFVIDPLYGLENRLEKGERGESVRKRRRVASRASRLLADGECSRQPCGDTGMP